MAPVVIIARMTMRRIAIAIIVATMTCFPGLDAENLWTACKRSEKQNQDKGSEKPQPYRIP